jgi:hypothetical protein
MTTPLHSTLKRALTIEGREYVAAGREARVSKTHFKNARQAQTLNRFST